MITSISRTMFTGFITLLPVILTLYLLYWLAVSSEQVMGGILRYVLPDVLYFPGLGVLAGLAVVFVVGLVMKAYFVRQIFALGEAVLYRLPIIKSVYRAIRDMFDFFSPNKSGLGQVVAVSIDGKQVIGFITQEDPERLPESFRELDSVLVYIPMSYMIGGFTLFIPRSDVRKLNMSMDEAMRFALTAGITGKN